MLKRFNVAERQAQNALDARQARACSHAAKETASHEKDYTCGFGIYTGYIGFLYSAASLPLIHKPTIPKPPSANKRVTRPNMLLLQRVTIPSEYFLEKIHRNFLTGLIVMEGVDPQYDASFVDLASRLFLEDTPEILSRDEFLMVPIPLPFRTWYYHQTFELENSIEVRVQLWNAGQKSIKSIDEIRQNMIEGSFFDVPSKSVMTYSPAWPCFIALFLSCFTLDKLTFYLYMILFFITARIALHTNLPTRIAYERPISILLRGGIAIWIGLEGTVPATERGVPVTESAIPGLIRLCSATIILIDCIVSDLILSVYMRLRRRCFKIVESLSTGLYICEVDGFGMSYTFPESVVGNQRFQEQLEGKRFALIADIHGILAELRPTTLKDFPEPIHTLGAVPIYSIGAFEDTVES